MEISLAKAKEDRLFYFVVTGTIYHPLKKKCLILQRSKREIVHPALWGVIGGKLEWNDLKNNPITRMNHDILDWEDLVEKLVKREAVEECNLVVGDLKYLDNVTYLRPDGVPTVCFKFAVKYKQSLPFTGVKRKSGNVKIAPEFDDYAWVDAQEVKKYKCIAGIHKEVAKTIRIFT